MLKSHLEPAIRFKLCSLLSSSVLLQHDNVWTLRAHAGGQFHLKCLAHPIYSPNLISCDCHVFGPVKEALGGEKFSMEEEIKEAEHCWL